MMGNQKDKLINKIREKPPRNDITFDEVCSALSELDFSVKRIKGSHAIFKSKDYPEIHFDSVPIPHGGSNCVKRGYIKNIQKMLEEIDELRDK